MDWLGLWSFCWLAFHFCVPFLLTQQRSTSQSVTRACFDLNSVIKGRFRIGSEGVNVWMLQKAAEELNFKSQTSVITPYHNSLSIELHTRIVRTSGLKWREWRCDSQSLLHQQQSFLFTTFSNRSCKRRALNSRWMFIRITSWIV